MDIDIFISPISLSIIARRYSLSLSHIRIGRGDNGGYDTGLLQRLGMRQIVAAIIAILVRQIVAHILVRQIVAGWSCRWLLD